MTIPGQKTISASLFKAHCLGLMDEIESRAIDGVIVTKRGKPVARLVPIDVPADWFTTMHGAMKDSFIVPADFDWEQPLFSEHEMRDRDVRLVEKFRDIL